MTEGPSSEQRTAILDAAFRRFARYGYRRTSLGDIAEEVGLSRPALYHYFRNKEDVFRALSQRINAGVVAAVAAAATQEGLALEERLYAVMAARVGWAFDLLHASEHGRELIDAKNRLCGPTSAETNARFAAVIAAILDRAAAKGEIALDGLDMSPNESAAFLVDCLQGLVGEVTDEAIARQRLRALARLFAAGAAKR
ncbi:MAG: helix-turn-helix domain-containing protein [Pseudomonadota bacterium]